LLIRLDWNVITQLRSSLVFIMRGVVLSMDKTDGLQFLLFYIKRVFPSVNVVGTNTKRINGKDVFLARGKCGTKTMRFLYGDDYPMPCQISTSQRKRLAKIGKIH